MKIYDCFTYCSEDEILELRLKILYNSVDKFVIIEGNKFHNGKTKKKNFDINKFKKYKKKIRYFFIKNFPTHNGNNWIYEKFQRRSISRGLFDANPNDIIMVSDVDEIPRINNKLIFENDSIIFLQNFYYYKINILCTEGLGWNGKWPGTKAIKYKFFEDAQKVRELRVRNIPKWRIDKKIKRSIIQDGGWHFSYLMNPKQIKKKITTFAHSEYNKKKFTNYNYIKKKIFECKDLFGRKNMKFEKKLINSSYPKEIFINKSKYSKWIA